MTQTRRKLTVRNQDQSGFQTFTVQLTSEYGTSSDFGRLPSVPSSDAVWRMERPKSELKFNLNGTSLDRYIYNFIYKNGLA